MSEWAGGEMIVMSALLALLGIVMLRRRMRSNASPGDHRKMTARGGHFFFDGINRSGQVSPAASLSAMTSTVPTKPVGP